MKPKLLYLLLFLMGCSLFSNAQDTTLPQGKSTIYLLSGKTIKEIRLWRIDTLKIEYVKNGNLADVKAADVSTVVFSDGTQKIFNKTNESQDVVIRNRNVRSVDSSWTFRRIHIYFGKGGLIPAYKDLFSKAFEGSPYVGTLRDNNGSIYELGGKPQLNFSEDVYLGLEYNLNSEITVGTWFRPFSSYFNGFNGEYDVAYHSVNERISGLRYCFNGSYALLHIAKPFRIEINGGGSLILFSGNVNTNISFYDTSGGSVNPPASHLQPVEEFSQKYRCSGTSVEIYAIANLYFGKGFSVFIKPYITYDEGFSVNAKTFSSHNQTAVIPEQRINFSGFGMLGGIAFHFWRDKHNKPYKTDSK